MAIVHLCRRLERAEFSRPSTPVLVLLGALLLAGLPPTLPAALGIYFWRRFWRD